MADTQTEKGHAGIRRVAPFAPIALALLMQNALLPPREGSAPGGPEQAVAATCEDVIDFRDCHERYPTGCTDSPHPQYDAYLNLMKNQLVPPTSQPAAFLDFAGFQNLDRKLPDGLTKGNHQKFKAELAALGEGRPYGAVGYLYYAVQTGAESCNCKLGGAEDTDFHIGIGFDAGLAKQVVDRRTAHRKVEKELMKQLQQESVIVEMTPHYRFRYEPNWTIDSLKDVLGFQVKVVGQLMADNEHNVPTQNCALAGADRDSCWRGSAWELHPVTRFQVCKNAAGCAPDSADWIDLDRFQPPAGT